jgi:uncharacterized protein YprB with RNaseH-like and TPR domain
MSDKLTIYLQHAATERQQDYVKAYFEAYGNVTKAAEALGIDRRALGRGIKAIKERVAESGLDPDLLYQPRVLFFDIETSPLVANAWGLWPKMLPGGYQAVLQDRSIISVGWKWRGDKYPSVVSWDDGDDSPVVETLHGLLNEADWVVAHNASFDVKHSQARMLFRGYPPPAPFKKIDTLGILRRNFKLTSNRLDDVCTSLFGIGKLDTGGLALWQGVMRGEEEALKSMEYYNLRDVELLELLYERIKGWDTSHPNYNMFASPTDEPRCTTCGSTNLRESQKTVKTTVSEFELLQCNDCGHWSRGRHNIRSKEAMESVLTNAK